MSFHQIPFHQILFSNKNALFARMTHLIGSPSSPNGNFSIPVQFGWASHLLIDFIEIPNGSPWQNSMEFVKFTVCPGNTKAQGNARDKALFQPPKNWTKKNELLIQGVPYSLNIAYHIKFSHNMGNYMCSLDFEEKNLRKDLYTLENFNALTGECTRAEWQNLEKEFDTCFAPDFPWRNSINWFDAFINSNKKQFNIAFGYGVNIVIPYTLFQYLDANNSVPSFLKDIETAFSTLIP